MQKDFIYRPPESPIEIIYRDRDVLISSKPAGLLSIPGNVKEREDSMLTRLKRKDPRVRIVHRLDMDTSGVMVFALRKKAEVGLREQFQKRGIKKEYKAVVQGYLKEPYGIIDAPIAPHPSQKLRHYVSQNGKSARTEYRVITTGDNCSLLLLKPITGRSHQLRVHLRYLGHPILGDRFYAPPDVLKRSDRLMLHAESIGFKQPYNRENLSFMVPAPFHVL